jgi:hypothetical protein
MDAARCDDQLSVCGSRKKGDLDGNFDFKRNPRTICHVFDNFLTRLLSYLTPIRSRLMMISARTCLASSSSE